HAPRGRERSRRCREAGRPGHAAAVGAHADRAGAARRGGQSDEGGAATRHFARHAAIPPEEIRAQWVTTPTIGGKGSPGAPLGRTSHNQSLARKRLARSAHLARRLLLLTLKRFLGPTPIVSGGCNMKWTKPEFE